MTTLTILLSLGVSTVGGASDFLPFEYGTVNSSKSLQESKETVDFKIVRRKISGLKIYDTNSQTPDLIHGKLSSILEELQDDVEYKSEGCGHTVLFHTLMHHYVPGYNASKISSLSILEYFHYNGNSYTSLLSWISTIKPSTPDIIAHLDYAVGSPRAGLIDFWEQTEHSYAKALLYLAYKRQHTKLSSVSTDIFQAPPVTKEQFLEAYKDGESDKWTLYRNHKKAFKNLALLDNTADFILDALNELNPVPLRKSDEPFLREVVRTSKNSRDNLVYEMLNTLPLALTLMQRVGPSLPYVDIYNFSATQLEALMTIQKIVDVIMWNDIVLRHITVCESMILRALGQGTQSVKPTQDEKDDSCEPPLPLSDEMRIDYMKNDPGPTMSDFSDDKLLEMSKFHPQELIREFVRRKQVEPIDNSNE